MHASNGVPGLAAALVLALVGCDKPAPTGTPAPAPKAAVAPTSTDQGASAEQVARQSRGKGRAGAHRHGSARGDAPVDDIMACAPA